MTAALPRGRRPAIVGELDCAQCRARARAEEDAAPLTQTPETGHSSSGLGRTPPDGRASLSISEAQS